MRVGPSPEWLKARLTAAGMRPISNAVDVTNYVMLALGNPLHVFDRSKLAQGRIVVRRATPGEELLTLDGELRKLDPSDLVIADAERAIALAGIMGGEETEVTDTTEDILLEAANFEPVGIMRSSERLALRTEGSNRWEKGVDPYLAEQAAIYATELLVELTKASYAGETDAQGDLPVRPVTRLRPERTDAVAGVAIPPTEQRRDPRAPRLRGRGARGRGHRARPGAPATSPARSTWSRRSSASTASRRCRSRCRSAGRCSGG